MAAAAARRLATLPRRVYVLAAVAALLFGIGFNALLLQRGRHPAPLFAPPAPSLPAPSASAVPLPPPAPPETAREAPALPAPAAAEPPARPAAADAGVRDNDPIGALLRSESQNDDGRLVLAAQNALIKLGYPVKADGNEGAATKQAIRDFERAHGLPPSEITPRLVKQLNAAATRNAPH